MKRIFSEQKVLADKNLRSESKGRFQLKKHFCYGIFHISETPSPNYKKKTFQRVIFDTRYPKPIKMFKVSQFTKCHWFSFTLSFFDVCILNSRLAIE